MGLPLAAGAPNYSNSGTSKFIPEIWAGKLLEKYYANCIYSEICNTDYEGEIKDYGDKVIIRTNPDIAIFDYEKNMELGTQTPESPSTELEIDQGHYFNIECDDVDKKQMDIAFMDKWADDGAQQMKIHVDKNILGSIFTGAAAVNSGATAGKDTGTINLGTAGSPLLVNKTNIIDMLVESMSVCLDETDTPDTDRFVILPPAMCARIKTSELKDASMTGDGMSTLRTGKVGQIDRLHIYNSRHLGNTSGTYDVLFGHKSATSFAAQLTEMETLRNPKKFGDLIRSLMVYGFNVLKPEQLGHSVMRLG